MNCFYHDSKPAIVSCAKCGVGLCRDCMTNAAYTYDGKPLCLNCSRPIAEEELKEAQSSRTWSVVKFIFSGFFLVIGLMAFAGGADLINVWIISGIAGIPTAFKATRRSREQRIMDEVHDRYEQDMMNLMFGWVIRLLIKLAFMIALAPLCAIYTCISNLIKFIKSKKKINEAKEALDYIDQCLNGEDSFIEQEPQLANQTSAEIPVQQVDSNQASTDAIPTQSARAFQTPPAVQSYQTPTSISTGRRNPVIISAIIGALVLVGLIAGYFVWYVPYAKDRDALRTYVVANNVFLRSSKMAGVEFNILSKVPYGSELITYSKDMEWAEIKVNGMKGFVASPYLLEWDDFKLLNDIWGNADSKEYIESSKCRLAILDYCKRNQFNTGNEGWQLYTLQKDVKPNNVLFPRLNNGYDKFTEFVFILKNNATQERRLAIYSFDEETEKPIFLYDESAPEDGQIKNVRYSNGRNEYNVTYTGNNTIVKSKEAYTQQQPQDFVEEIPNIPAVEELVIIEDDAQTGAGANNDVAVTNTDDNNIYGVVEQMPEFPNGGMTGLMNFIGKNLIYPPVCQESGVQGRVIVSFVVNKDGSTTDFSIVRSVDKYLDKEALRVLNNMPKWKPGKQKGVPVRVKYTIPISFKLS